MKPLKLELEKIEIFLRKWNKVLKLALESVWKEKE
jgi:hypothetical protein